MHDQNPQPQTLASSLEHSPFTETLPPKHLGDPQKASLINQVLVELASHCLIRNMPPSQVSSFLSDYIEDLKGFTLHDIAAAAKFYRRNPENVFFPHIGVFRDIVDGQRILREFESRQSAAFRSVGSAERPGVTITQPPENRPLLWWLQRKRFWKSHWSEDDIPSDQRGSYFVWLDKVKSGQLPRYDPAEY